MSNPDLDDFLKKIDEIEAVLKGMNSDDSKKVESSMKKCDELIKDMKEDVEEIDGVKTKIGINKTIINKSDSKNEPSFKLGPANNTNSDTMGQDAFMRMMEQDANERYERKKENKKKSDKLKLKGNEEFKNENYEKAIEYYTEGLSFTRDDKDLYTNRAQAFIKLEKFKEAVSDCDWALRVDENAAKAMIHKGRALTFLKDYKNALVEFKNAKKIQNSPIIDRKKMPRTAELGKAQTKIYKTQFQIINFIKKINARSESN